MSTNLPENAPAAAPASPMSVEEMENVNGGSFGGLVMGIADIYEGGSAMTAGAAAAPETLGGSLVLSGAGLTIATLGVHEVADNI